MALAILVLGCCLALVIDQLWLDAARGEMITATQAAALAGARRLAHDDRINDLVDPQDLAQATRQAARLSALENLVAGEPLRLDAEPYGDIRLGHLVREPSTGQVRFLETDYFPTTVAISGSKTRRFGNPVARLFGGLTGHDSGDAHAIAEATINNRVIGIRPFENGPVPAWPIAILEHDPSGQRIDTWVAQIESGLGSDQYSWNDRTKRVEAQADGLPEIHLHAMPAGGEPDEANLQLVDFGSGFRSQRVLEQLTRGLRISDLEAFGGELVLSQNRLRVETRARISGDIHSFFSALIGHNRILFLYGGFTKKGSQGGTARLTRFVGGRIMAVQTSGDGTPRIVIQPSVVATRTALVIDPQGADTDENSFRNPYLYKISLTN